MLDFIKNVWTVFAKNVQDSSTANNLNKVDWAKIVRNTLQVSGSAALAAGVGYLGKELLNIDWGTVSILALPIIHFVMDAITKKFKDNTDSVKLQ
jgi:hypothetical protein